MGSGIYQTLPILVRLVEKVLHLLYLKQILVIGLRLTEFDDPLFTVPQSSTRN